MIAWTQLWALYRVADHYDLDGMHLDISNSSAVLGAIFVHDREFRGPFAPDREFRGRFVHDPIDSSSVLRRGVMYHFLLRRLAEGDVLFSPVACRLLPSDCSLRQPRAWGVPCLRPLQSSSVSPSARERQQAPRAVLRATANSAAKASAAANAFPLQSPSPRLPLRDRGTCCAARARRPLRAGRARAARANPPLPLPLPRPSLCSLLTHSARSQADPPPTRYLVKPIVKKPSSSSLCAPPPYPPGPPRPLPPVRLSPASLPLPQRPPVA